MTPDEFKSEVSKWADRIGVTYREIHLRSMRNKWASCSSKGRITFDPSLLDAPDNVRLEAVIHELLHLRYPDHGGMFRMMLNTYLNMARDRYRISDKIV